MSIRCGISFQSADEFRAAFVARAPVCFVPYPDEVAPGQVMEVDVAVQDARLEVRGEVGEPDFDESGNVGLQLRLDEPSVLAVAELDRQLKEGQVAPVLSATSRDTQRTGRDGVPRSLEAAPELLQPGAVIDGRFRIESHLATGGMGEVYRAEHVLLKRAVAVKVLRRAFSHDAEMWSRFEREAQLVSQLESPHVVRVFDFGRTSDGQLFLAMEFVNGQTVDQRLQQRGPMSPEQAVEVMCQVLDGLAEAHELGIVHRDLKPPNIILGQRRDGGERAKILDFGIARLGDGLAKETEPSKLTQLGMIIGTPAYLAPEQALSGELDARTDIYAAGCVAFALLTGRPPFDGEDLRKIINSQLTVPPPSPADVRPELSALPELCQAVLKALAKDKEQRYQNVDQFADALRNALAAAGRAVPPRPDPSSPWPQSGASLLTAPPAALPPVSTPSVIAAPLTPSPVAVAPPPAPEPIPAPPPPAPAPVAEAPKPPPPAPSRQGLVAIAEPSPYPYHTAEAFFSSTPSGIAAEEDSDDLDVFPTLRGVVPKATRLALQQPPHAADGAWVRMEILGPPHGSSQAKACLGRVLEAVLRRGGFLMSIDDESVTVGFDGNGGPPWGRTTRALLELRTALSHESVKQQVPATVRALAGLGELPPPPPVVEKARQQLTRAKPNTLWLDATFAGGASRLCEVQAVQPNLISLGALRRTVRTAPELIGRKQAVEAIERRLNSLMQGLGAPVVVTGAAGSGLSSLGQLLISVARKRGALALMTNGLAMPFGPLVELLCMSVGVDVPDRVTKLGPALDALGLPESSKLAALALAGVKPWPNPLTAGQAAHTLRTVLKAAAGQRPTVLVLDGLHGLDTPSVEAFLAMAAAPASRELLVGLTAPSSLDAHLAALPKLVLPDLTESEVQRMLHVWLGSPPGPVLLQYLQQRAAGAPARMLELLAWLEEGGYLFEVSGTVELSEQHVRPPKSGPLSAAMEALSKDERLVLHAAVALSERFDWIQLREVAGAQQAITSLQAAGWLVPEGPRKGRLRSASMKDALPPLSEEETLALRTRCANALIAQGKVDPNGVDTMALAGHLLATKDFPRAGQLWKHALDQALGRRDAAAASRAWEGLSEAIAGMPASEAQARSRIDALARAAIVALTLDDAARARQLVDRARAVTGAAPTMELFLADARVLRVEGRRVKAAEALTEAENAAAQSPARALVLAERGEARELEGDLVGSARAFEEARKLADAAAEIARWHGEISLPARLEARLATIVFALRDVGKARTLLEASLAKWRTVNWPYAEARVLSTLGTVLVFQQRYTEASVAYESAGITGAKYGDLQFQARALLQQAKAIRKHKGDGQAVRAPALEARKLAVALSWEQGRLDATALLGG